MIPWQDPAGAVLLLAALVGTWKMALDKRTSVNARAAYTKAASSAGFIVVNVSLGLYISAVVSLAFVVAFIIMATSRAHAAVPA